MGQRDFDDDRKIAAPGNDQIALGPQQGEQHHAGDEAAQSRRPQRRNALDHRLGHRPIGAPGEDDDGEQQKGEMSR